MRDQDRRPPHTRPWQRRLSCASSQSPVIGTDVSSISFRVATGGQQRAHLARHICRVDDVRWATNRTIENLRVGANAVAAPGHHDPRRQRLPRRAPALALVGRERQPRIVDAQVRRRRSGSRRRGARSSRISRQSSFPRDIANAPCAWPGAGLILPSRLTAKFTRMRGRAVTTRHCRPGPDLGRSTSSDERARYSMSAMTIGGWCSIVISGDGPTALLRHRDRLGQRVGALPAQDRGHVRVVGADDDHLADVLAAVLAPVPHEERVRAVVRVAAPVHLDVARVVRELVLVLLRAASYASRVSGSRRLKNSM